MKTIILIGLVSILSLQLSGCLIGATKAATTSTTTTSTGTTTATPTATPTPTVGMNCTGTDDGYDNLAAAPVFSVSGLTGSSINSVQMNLLYATAGATILSGGTHYTTSITLTAYTCGSSGSLGSSVGSATTVVGLNGTPTTTTFTFSSPIAIPSNGACSGGQTPLVFKITGSSAVGGYVFWAESGIQTASCFANQSTSTTGVVNNLRDWTVIINANQ